MTVTALKAYLELRTPQLAGAEGKFQNPVIENQLPGSASPVMFGIAKRLEPITTITFDASRQGIVILEGPRAEIKRGEANTGPWQVELEAGVLHARR